MKFVVTRKRWALLIIAGLLSFLVTASYAQAHDLKLEAQLIWGTSDTNSPDPHHKPVEPAVERKLKRSPFKWSNYFEVNRKTFTVPANGEHREQLSKDCEIKVRNLGDSHIEVQLFGKGKLVGRINQSLPKNDMLITGGNAENLTAWFVVLRQVE